MGETEARFRLLGPIQLSVEGRQVDIGAVRARSVLAVLLWEDNHVVPVDRLVERVWGDRRLPEEPRRAVQTYVSLLRRSLAGVADAGITRRAGGYLIEVDEQSVDVRQFHALTARARAAERDEQAVSLFEQALELWHGEAFGSLDTPWATGVRAALDQERRAAERDLTDRRLRQGLHATLLAGLSTSAADHPLDERLAAQLMLALFRAGRQADALDHYERVRARLTDELGADPGAGLQILHRQILTHDPALAAPAPHRPPAGRAIGVAAQPVVVPHQLPAPPRPFTGRARELAGLSAVLDGRAESPRTLVISAIGGAGGIGKTWLALHWAHQNAERFPDGQLFVDLRGFDPRAEPLPVQSALRGFLGALGVAPSAIPAEPEEQVALYRSLVAGRRLLVLLDNAPDADSVAPLLPGGSGCTVLVTSRRRLGGLVASHGAHPFELDVLTESEARRVLTRYLGAERVAAESEAVARLVAGCAGLPLALGIMAARALIQPGLTLAALADELQDASARLEALDVGSPTANLRATLACSYRALPPDAADALGLLALAPGSDFGVCAAADLLGMSNEQTRRVLGALEGGYLIQQYTPGRYRMHDLVRLYAVDRAEQDHEPAARDAALRRVLDHHIHTAHLADHLLDPHRPRIRLDPPAAGVRSCTLPDDRAALAWFEAEHANLLAARHAAAARDWHSAVWQLAWALSTFHTRRGHRHEELALWQAAAEAAVHLADPTARTLALRFLGRTCSELGRHRAAVAHLQTALALAELHGDPPERARTRQVLARVWEKQGDYRHALEHIRHAADLYHALDQPTWEGDALNATGWYAAHLGDYDNARIHCRAALALHRRHHNPDGEAATLDSLGFIEVRSGRHHDAVGLYRQALALRRDLGNTYYSADTLESLGECHAALGQHRQARTAWQEALTLYRSQLRDEAAERLSGRLAELPGADEPR